MSTADEIASRLGPARVFSLRDGFIYAASSAVRTQTKRHPAVILISRSGEPFVVETRGERLEGEAMLVAPQVLRTLTAEDCGLISIHIEPGHATFPALVAMDAPVKPIERSALRGIEAELDECLDGTISVDGARKIIDTVAAHAVEEVAQRPRREARIDRVLHRLMEQSPLDYDFDQLLDATRLSSSRFSHVFTREAGLTLRSFLMWRKAKEAFRLFNSGLNLTEIAHASGFSDSAHFSRTFQSTIGLLPSLMASSKFIKVVNWERH